MKYIKLLIVFFLPMNICFSQDLITKRTGEDIKAKILEVGINEIKYKNFDNQNGPTYSLLKNDILIIRYENGTKDLFDISVSNQVSLSPNNSNSFFIQGEKDAMKYYKSYKSAQTGTMLTGIILTPIAGLVPAIATSTTDPEYSNLNFPSSELMNNTDYYNGYTTKAKKIKQNKVWTSWLIALGVDFLAYLAISR